jgi:hypothetical protein
MNYLRQVFPNGFFDVHIKILSGSSDYRHHQLHLLTISIPLSWFDKIDVMAKSTHYYYDDYFSKVIPKDGFGFWPQWREEINKWLEFTSQVSKSEYEINKKRVVRDNEREGFLGEIKSVYFIGKILGLKIKCFEPSKKGGHDFSFVDKNGEEWQTEIKAPSWKGPIMKSTALSDSQKRERIGRPQYNLTDSKASFISPEKEIQDSLEDPTNNSLKQFVKGENNLLIVTPNMDQQIFSMIAAVAMGESVEKVIKDVVEKYDTDKVISAILILEPTINVKCNYYNIHVPVSYAPRF